MLHLSGSILARYFLLRSAGVAAKEALSLAKENAQAVVAYIAASLM